MQKITVRPQSYPTGIVKRVLRPLAQFAITAIEVIEKFDSKFFTNEDTWQMRLFFYCGYFVAVPLFIVWMKVMFY